VKTLGREGLQVKGFVSQLWQRFQYGVFSSRQFLPAEVRRRDVASEEILPGHRVETFDEPASLAINAARLEHLASLNLPVEGKRVLDVGCSVGHYASAIPA
jgi:2-polyprenyl-3-methyl-5-hydroxy-6-metoxy-1,4-benzoquinol methylase